ncbi:methytransferase partner Trm112 [Methanonatronarchaeum sp. AMET6-2]|uniref:methytransferase partner Trm112 n=1 Tax=Methanonatronarchaeum sp. AMET6-2 TaxID=2933293 RepID=UPI00120ECC46|nr:methytransferase partner Trm112 [Methanonatronarchaeum sp. AMET6-2]RZN62032.1 MAG: Trm112 family protein [Methanonatronarchaeia archaeon]UOY10355.1 methytransferase partner Trm112 [Methanonatronarchaeum sp. AMET6-2]
MKKKLLDKLVCPKCREKLELNEEEMDGDKIISGTLTCSSCTTQYPVEEGIPNLLPEE